MPQTTPDILAAYIKCFHLNTAQLIPEFVVIHSPHAGLFAVTTRSSQKLREASAMLTDWSICLDLSPRYQLQLMGVAPPTHNDLEPASASTFEDIHNQQPPQTPPEEPNASGPENI